MTTFDDLKLSPETLEILKAKGYETPSPIQEQTIPILLERTYDVIGQSQTGSGKTAAFGLPIIENLLKSSDNDGNIRALILTPSRELAIQVGNEIKSFIGKRKLRTFTIYGGQSYITEKRAISNGIDILVGTPGRIIDHMSNGLLKFGNIEYFVLDEADEMLNMGFIDDIEDILKNCPKTKNTLFFSATMPSVIMKICKKYMNEYKTVAVKSKQLTTDTTKQYYYMVNREDKLELLSRVLDMEKDFYGIVFCKTRDDVDQLNSELKNKQYNVDSLHGDIRQNQREKSIGKFKDGKTDILIATDVAARGLDVKNLTHVINYTIPQNAEDYTHRVGRTGRAGKEGIAITFVTRSEARRLSLIKKITKSEIQLKKIPEVEDVIEVKKENIKNIINKIIENKKNEDYLSLAKELLKIGKDEEVISSLLRYFLKDTLSIEKYKTIADFSAPRFKSRTQESGPMKVNFRTKFDNKSGVNKENNKGVRIFIARGKSAGMTPRTMVEFISSKTGVDQRHIDDMDVMDKFSFFTTSGGYAKKIVSYFEKIAGNDKPLVTYSKKSR